MANMQLLLQATRSALKSDLVKKISATFGTQVLRLILSFIISVVTTRVLGPSNRGIFALALTTGALGVQFGNLGLQASNTYYVARGFSVPLLLGNTILISFGFGSALSILMWSGLYYFPELIGLHGPILILTVAWIPFGLAYLLGLNLLLGTHQIRSFNLSEIINRISQLAIILLLILMGIRSAEGIFAGMLSGLILGCVYVFLRLRTVGIANVTVSVRAIWQHTGYALKAYLTMLFCFIVIRSDLFLVQKFLGIEQAGFYSVAATLADAILLLPTTVAMVIFPKLSEIANIRSKLRLTWKAALTIATILLPAFVCMALFSRTMISLLFGGSFIPACAAFVLLLPGIFFLGLHSVVVQLLNGIGYPKVVVWIWACCAILNITANWFVIPRFGIQGAALVSSACYTFAFLAVTMVILRLRALTQSEIFGDAVVA
jgi:O-antigen/teichoic acid export membrane protein